MNKAITDYTREELMNYPISMGKVIRGIEQIVIVPLEEPYDDLPYGCMKYIFINSDWEIIGAVGGCSDALMFVNKDALLYKDITETAHAHTTQQIHLHKNTPGVKLAVDYLMTSNCVRLHSFGTYTYPYIYTGTNASIIMLEREEVCNL